MSRKLFIFGMGNFAEMAHYLFTNDSDYQVQGFVVDAPYLDRSTFKELPVVAYEEFRSTADRQGVELFVALGVAELNMARARKVAQVEADGFRLASFVSSHALVPPDLVVAPNVMIMDMVTVHPQVRIGSNTIIWSSTGIAIKARIGSNVWITSAVIGDSTVIGDYSFVGLHATIGSFVTVGSHNMIGAAAVIMRDTKDYEIYRGPRSVAAKSTTRRARTRSLIR